MINFALVGAAGYIAPRHLAAIHNTNNRLVAALDPNDSVGVLDRYFPDALFFKEPERFDRFLDKRRRLSSEDQIHWVSICSPNYLHDAHIRIALRNGCSVLCEKPLVINPWNLDALSEIEAESGKVVNAVLQLRYHKPLQELKSKLERQVSRTRSDIVLTYVTKRGRWYDVSWKGNEVKSGGVVMNIGVHFFDLCIWLFGEVHENIVLLKSDRRMSGVMELEHARVRWFLSVEGNDLPPGYPQQGKSAYRSITIDGEELEFSDGFTDLHSEVYKQALAGNGFGIKDARPSIQAVYDVRHNEVSKGLASVHPFIVR